MAANGVSLPDPAPASLPVVILGGGISGLACAFHLQRAGVRVLVVEASSRPGGVIATIEKDGFRFDLGPQSFLSTAPLLSLIGELGLQDQLLRANPRAPRYILVRGKLVAAPLAPPSLLATPLFNASTKWRLVSEIFRRAKPPEDDESVAAFVRRKFGDELLDCLVAPFVSGVYAGDPEKLSLRAAFPKVHELESKYGSVLRGAMRSRPGKGAPRPGLCSFRDGMEALPRAIAARLGSSLLTGARADDLRQRAENGKTFLEINLVRNGQRETLRASSVVVATPADAASQVLCGLSDQFAALLSQIEYVPVAVLSAGYRQEQFRGPAEGFGFLVPRSEGLRVLGTVFSSSLFARRAPAGTVSVTSFAGGATDRSLLELGDNEITETICAEVARVLGISGAPVATILHRLPRALPQYNLGHTQLVKSLEALTASVPGLFLAGNYLSGPSLGSCIEQAERTAEAVRACLATTAAAART